MEYKTMGQLIQSLRKEKGLTQKQLAEMLNITDKAVSKWERDVACPDTATIPKLAEILGVSGESLLNAKIDQPAEIDENESSDLNPLWEHHRDRFKELIMQGIPGVIIGFIIMMIISVSAFKDYFQASGEEFWAAVIFVSMLVVAGALMFAGFPYGWKLVNSFTERWLIYGNIIIVLFLWALKFGVSVLVGAYLYPVVLVYNLIRSQKSKRKVRMWFIIVITIVIAWNAFLGVYSYIDSKKRDNKNGTDGTGASVVQIVDVDAFSNQSVLLDSVCQSALNDTKEEENDIIINYGWTVTETTKLHGVYFMEAKNPDNPHYNILEKLNLSNAVVVVTGYYLEEADPISVNQWEMDVTAYPNFIFDENNSLTYDSDSVYSHSLRSDDMEDLMEWLSGEYADMTITEISHS